MPPQADEYLWIEFSGVVVGVEPGRIRFAGDPVAGGMEPFWMSRKGVRRILYTNGTWSVEPYRGRGVCVIEMAAWAARQVGLG